MKRMIKFITAALTCIIMLSFLPITTSASAKTGPGYNKNLLSKCGVYDNKELFSEKELEALNKLVRDTSEKLELHIAIYLSNNSLSESSTAEFADDYYDELFGTDSDGVLYYMDLSGGYSSYDFISTAGRGILLYQDDIDRIFDHAFYYLPSSGSPIIASEIYEAIEQICYAFESYGNDKISVFDYAYDEYTHKYIYYKNGKTVVSSMKPLVPALLDLLKYLPVGAIAGFIYYFSVKSRYKFKPSFNARAYASNSDTRFTKREDIFIRTYTTKTKIESSSSGGHRSGRSGHGRSGGSHGGGGRRR